MRRPSSVYQLLTEAPVHWHWSLTHLQFDNVQYNSLSAFYYVYFNSYPSKQVQILIWEMRRSICNEFCCMILFTIYRKSGHIIWSDSSVVLISPPSPIGTSFLKAWMGRNSRPLLISLQTIRVYLHEWSLRKLELRICILNATVRAHSESSTGTQSYGSSSKRLRSIKCAPWAINITHNLVFEWRHAICLKINNNNFIAEIFPNFYLKKDLLHLQRCLSFDILYIAIYTRLKQYYNSFQIIIMQSCPMKNCIIVVITNSRVGAMLQQHTNNQ